MRLLNAFAAAALCLVPIAGAAEAADFSFAYTTIGGDGASGVVSATGFGSFYSVDDVTGTRDGAAITGYDFFDDTPQSFQFAGGHASDIDFSYYVGGANYEIRHPGTGYGTEFLNDESGTSSLLVTAFSLTPVTAVAAAAPEPAAWVMMLVGFAAIGSALRRTRARRSGARRGEALKAS